MVFPIPRQRFVLVEAIELYSAEQLANTIWRGNPKAGVALLLPRSFRGNGKLKAIQRSFVNIVEWSHVPLQSDSKWEMWLANTGSGKDVRQFSLR